jgi:hypothetical protein
MKVLLQLALVLCLAVSIFASEGRADPVQSRSGSADRSTTWTTRTVICLVGSLSVIRSQEAMSSIRFHSVPASPVRFRDP